MVENTKDNFKMILVMAKVHLPTQIKIFIQVIGLMITRMVTQLTLGKTAAY